MSFLFGLRNRPSNLFIAVLITGIIFASSQSSWAYTKDSPEVKKMVKGATDYLSKSNDVKHGDGGAALIGMAMYKAGIDTSHPKIQAGIAAARAMANRGAERISETYSPAVGCIFLCEIDADKYRPEIGKLVQGMLRRQHPNGCWSYSASTFDDTSQTQYGVLSLWTAKQHHFEVPLEPIERAARWLMQHQDATGGWCYMPAEKDTGSHAMHKAVTPSMSSAGAGSLYMCAHLLGFAKQADSGSDENELAPAVRRVEKEEKGSSEFLGANRPMLTRSLASGDTWFSRNLNFNTDWWMFYYMYGLERYKSFQELVEGNTVSEPDWYNKGVQFLQKTQRADGSWASNQNATVGPAIKTSFAVLFLTRSSQTTIRKAVPDEGILLGGKTLPKNLTNIMMQDGKVVTPQMIQDVDSLLKLLEETEDLDFDPSSLPGGLPLDEDLTKRTSQLEKLREMVSDDKYEKRLAAVKTLARARELDNVPALIYALDDPAPQVALEARDGLRFISRKFFGFGLIIEPIGEGLTGEARAKALQTQRSRAQAAQAKWTEWYLSIRPEGELIH